MGFELTEHTADVGVTATGTDLGATFAGVADGLAAASCTEVPDGVGERRDVSVAAESVEALLFDYCQRLIVRRDVDAVLPVDNRATVTAPPEEDADWTLSGSYRAVPLSEVVARDVKAMTYAEMAIEETDEGWRAHVVFDV